MNVARACPTCGTPLPEEAQACSHCGAPTPTGPGVHLHTRPDDTPELDRVRRALAAQYRVERVLGSGGMATVYLAEDLKHRRHVAVKVMRPELSATLGADRFLREVEIAAKLSHPHILPVFDSGAADGLLYYVMPYVEGETLRDRLLREGKLPVDAAVRLARDVADALAYAHARGIIHRDIKPANVLLGSGYALVADFGIARAVDSGAALTQTGLSVGTPQYMSPEQSLGEGEVDGRSDVYAIGCVLYEMMAGQPPYMGPTPQAILARSLTQEVRPLAALRPEVPAPVAAVVARAMARNVAERYQSAGELVAALDALQEGGRTGATPSATAGPSARRVGALFGVAAAAVLAVVYAAMSQLGLPPWAFAVAVVLMAAGWPVLQLTRKVEARRRAGREIQGLRRFLSWRTAIAGGVLAVLAWAAVATALVVRGSSGDGAVKRLAVLPFVNRGAAADDYFVDGIADQVRGKLAELAGVEVTARTSSDLYRQTAETPQAIGRELGVDYLLTATVSWAPGAHGGRRVQVVPELISARTAAVTWQQTFDADVTDVFKVQGTIATQVAGALGVALGSAEQRQLARRPTDNVAAYDLYLKGRSLSGNDPATLRQAAGFYEQATALDSGFAEAWASLSSTLTTLYFNSAPEPSVAREARSAAEHALAADPEGAAGHRAMGQYYLSVLKSPVQAEEELTLALRAAPKDPPTLLAAAGLEASLGRWNETVAHLELARRLDPRVPPASLARTLTRLRRYPEALQVGRAALALAPSNLNVIETLAMVYLAQGDLEGARAVIRNAPATLSENALVAQFANYFDLMWVLDEGEQQVLLRLPPSAFDNDRPTWAGVLAQTYALRGDLRRARAYADTARQGLERQLRATPDDAQLHTFLGLMLAYLGRKAEAIREGELGLSMLPISKDANNGPYMQHQLVRIYLIVGENDKALDELEPLLRVPYNLSPGWLRIDPNFKPLRGDPRFERLAAGP
jgi:TolB-like protein/tRNA A-37 threonylcarbamoyl transferase component Bud32/thioredoxin-like negative regulator of GroEL